MRESPIRRSRTGTCAVEIRSIPLEVQRQVTLHSVVEYNVECNLEYSVQPAAHSIHEAQDGPQHTAAEDSYSARLARHAARRQVNAPMASAAPQVAEDMRRMVVHNVAELAAGQPRHRHKVVRLELRTVAAQKQPL